MAKGLATALVTLGKSLALPLVLELLDVFFAEGFLAPLLSLLKKDMAKAHLSLFNPGGQLSTSSVSLAAVDVALAKLALVLACCCSLVEVGVLPELLCIERLLEDTDEMDDVSTLEAGKVLGLLEFWLISSLGLGFTKPDDAFLDGVSRKNRDSNQAICSLSDNFMKSSSISNLANMLSERILNHMEVFIMDKV